MFSCRTIANSFRGGLVRVEENTFFGKSWAMFDKTLYMKEKLIFFSFSATTTLRLSCAGGEVVGSYVHIEDNRNRVDYFSLCEIQIFVNKGIIQFAFTANLIKVTIFQTVVDSI